MDSRIEPLVALGLVPGDAKILRNAGGRVTHDVLRSLVLATTYLNITAVAVMHHTDCGSGLFADDELRHGFADRGGYDDAELAALAVLDPAATVPVDVEKIVSAPQVSTAIKVSGYSYDVKTGLVTTVVPPRSRQPG